MKTDHDNMPTQFLNVLRLISVYEIDVLKLKIAEYFAFASVHDKIICIYIMIARNENSLDLTK